MLLLEGHNSLGFVVVVLEVMLRRDVIVVLLIFLGWIAGTLLIVALFLAYARIIILS